MTGAKLMPTNHRTYMSTILQQFVDVEIKHRISTPVYKYDKATCISHDENIFIQVFMKVSLYNNYNFQSFSVNEYS